MRSRHRRCRQCGRRFRPHPQTAYKQKTCSRKACQRQRHLQGCRVDHAKRPERDRKRRDKIRAWARGYPNYWQRYRQRHPSYRERDNARRRRAYRRAVFSAKRDESRQNAVERLRRIRAMASGSSSAKPDVCDRRVEKVIDFLVWKEFSAKPDESPSLGREPHNSGHGFGAMGDHPSPL